MALTLQDVTDIWAKIMSDASSDFTQINLLKNELKQAVQDTEDWVEANQGSYNSALSATAQSNLTAKQKAWLISEVVRRRWEIS